jgi:hypothetical protein
LIVGLGNDRLLEGQIHKLNYSAQE